MQPDRPGQVFEAEVNAALRRTHACMLHGSRSLDVNHKIDFEIRGIGPKVLTMPVQVQITRRVDHFGKLNAYLNTRWMNRNIVSLYVEVHDGPTVAEVAEHLVWAAQEAQELPPYGPRPIFGLRIDAEDATFFNPQDRLIELQKQRSTPEYLADMKSGLIYRYDEHGFWVMPEGSLEPYFAHYIDAYAAPLRHRLRGRELRIPVRFKPIAPGRAIDVRAL